MNAVSFDPSLTATGVWISSTGESLTIRTDRQASRQFRLATIMGQTEAILDRASPQIIFIEAYAFGVKNSSSVTQQAEVGGVIRACAGRRGLSVIEVPPMSWKSAILGSARVRMKKRTAVEKAAYLSAVKERTGKAFRNPDEADAYMLWLYADRIRSGVMAQTDMVNRVAGELTQAGIPVGGRLFA